MTYLTRYTIAGGNDGIALPPCRTTFVRGNKDREVRAGQQPGGPIPKKLRNRKSGRERGNQAAKKGAVRRKRERIALERKTCRLAR